MSELLPPRVLAIAEDPRGFVTACRMTAPLLALKRSGLIGDYWITDPSLLRVPPGFTFDVVWLQRAVHERVTRRVLEVLGDAFLLDIDDLLISRPAYIEPGHLPPADHIVEAVRRCRVLTTTSVRLAGLLEERTGAPLRDKLVVCPNALEFPTGWTRSPERPGGLILTQGHRLALTTSAAEVFGAVSEFAATHALPVYVFGPPAERLGDQMRHLIGDVIPCGVLDFWHYHAALAAWPTLIGIAPLETRADKETLDFIAGKSDVKMVEYGGFGHPAVYSDAPPYRDTDLSTGALAENSHEGWREALESVLRDDPSTIVNQREIAAARSVAAVAPQWRAALDGARLERPRTAADLQDWTVRAATVLLARGAAARTTLRQAKAAAAARRRPQA